MKKFAALLLALCMMVAAIPALADDVTGNWYMTLAEVTMGNITLNEDGTAVADLLSSGEMTGTWTADDTGVTITIDGDALTFAYDGTTLFSEMFPIPMTREEGKLNMDLMSKFMAKEEGIELPEGMTEADLTVIATNFLAEYMKLMEEASGEEAPAEEAPAEEAPAEEAPAEAEAAVAP